MSDLVIYTKDDCPYCIRVKALLKSKDVAYEEIDVTHDAGRQAEVIERSGRRTVPQIFIDRRSIGGYDDLPLWMLRGSSIACWDERQVPKGSGASITG